MWKGGLRLALVTVVIVLAAPVAASATTLPSSFAPSCPTSSPSGDYGGVRICSGEVTSFDGAALDVDVTQPMQNTGATHPLIIMLHGFGNNKHEWESTTDEGDGADKWHWNNHWFAEHGYYVLTYTARGFRDDGPYASYQPPTPSVAPWSVSTPNGTLHVKSRDYEIRDTQWLAALVAATYPDVDPSRVAVTGGSYGGGESWMQASQAHWDFYKSLDPTLPALDLQVAIPKYPWTDLAYSLAPNGHGGGPSRTDIYESSQAVETDNNGGGTPATGSPLGVPKFSYILGLFALGNKQGVFDEGTDVPPPSDQDCTGFNPPAGENCEENIPLWNTRITITGDPYPDEDPILQQAARGLTELRSAYYQDEGWTAEQGERHVAVFSIQGWTDDLFEAIESFRMFKYLKRLDPLWPVAVAVADVGHSPAQNKPATWQRLNDQAFQFLQSQINGSHRQQTTVSSQATICNGEPDQPPSTPADEITATTPEGLSQGTLSITYGGGKHILTNPGGAVDPNGPRTDPIITQGACQTAAGSDVGGYTGTSDPLPNRTTYVGLGEVDVHVTLLPPADQAQVDARVWDVAPDGSTFLVTRGTYRIDVVNGFDSPDEDIRLPLFGNEWRLMPGHRIRLDLTQVDMPYLRLNSSEPSSIHYDSPKLVLPTREEQQQTLIGSP
jgi:pimeloyl-ACP methyl ester carboxylesterase